MPRVKARNIQTEEDTFQGGIRDYRGGKFPSIRKVAAHHMMNFTTHSKILRGMSQPTKHNMSALSQC
jgi:DNA-binding transcriptional regulator YhcF (GntR family)